jgi:GNAT superfamily N-acetyltransferase
MFDLQNATAEDEDRIFEFELGYFKLDPNHSVEEMASRWSEPDCWPRKQFRESLSLKRGIVVVDTQLADGEARTVVGWLRWDQCKNDECECNKKAACVGHIFVDAQYRGNMLGRRLLGAFDERAVAEGFTSACITAESWNHGPAYLYRSHGYTPVADSKIGTMFLDLTTAVKSTKLGGSGRATTEDELDEATIGGVASAKSETSASN